MDDLDRLGWAVGFSFRSYGVRVGVRVNDAALIPRINALLPPDASLTDDAVVDHLCSVRTATPAPRKGVRSFHLAYSDITRVARSLDLDEVLDVVEGDLRLFVAALARRRLFVHAAVVAWNGRAIVIPGSSHSGKSTLTEALVRAGATYYSDEYAVLDQKGLVHPFAAPMSIRPDGPGRAQRVAVSSLGGAAGARPLPVGLVLATHYQKGARRWQPRTLTPGETVMELFRHTVAAQRLGGKAFGILRQVSMGATGLRGIRPDAKTAAAEILRRLDRISPLKQHTARRPNP